MKENILFVLKEVMLCIGIAIIAVGLNIFLFKNYFMNNVTVDSAKTELYAAIDKSKYVLINADIQEEQNPTQKYETVNEELDNYQTEYRYVPGTINPFMSSENSSDLPSETIGVNNSNVSGDIQLENNG